MPKDAHGNEALRSKPNFLQKAEGRAVVLRDHLSPRTTLRWQRVCFSDRLSAVCTKRWPVLLSIDGLWHKAAHNTYSPGSMFLWTLTLHMLSPPLPQQLCLFEEKAVPVNSGLAARPTALPTLHGVPVSSDLWVVIFAVKYSGLN